MENQMTMTKQDKVENNKLYAIEIKNEVLRKLPRNIDITSIDFSTKFLKDTDDSVRVTYEITLDGQEAGSYSWYSNCMNENYSFETLVKSQVLNLSDWAE